MGLSGFAPDQSTLDMHRLLTAKDATHPFTVVFSLYQFFMPSSQSFFDLSGTPRASWLASFLHVLDANLISDSMLNALSTQSLK